MDKAQQNLQKVREYLSKSNQQGTEITVKQLASDLNMPLAEAAEAVQRLEFTDDVDDLK